MKVLVIGAHGRTGQRVVKQLLDGKHMPVAMIRDTDQRGVFDEMGVSTVLADLEYPIDHAVAGCDAVIFAAGSGAKTGKDKTVLIDHVGAIRSMVTAAVQGARRYVMLSSRNADPDSESKIRHYHRAKGHADAFLMKMDEVMEETLDWTILCPGRLTDEASKQSVSVSPEIDQPSGETSREVLAEALVACLDEPATVGKRFALLDGEIPLADALRSV